MFLLILDKNPYKAAEFIPDRLKFKSLLELCQLCAGAGITDKMKPINQGKELQKWISKHKSWTYSYMVCLANWTKKNIKTSMATIYKIDNIMYDLFKIATDFKEPTTAIFRYVKEYAEFTEYESNSELPIDVAISEYKRYLEYKEEQFNKKRCKK